MVERCNRRKFSALVLLGLTGCLENTGEHNDGEGFNQTGTDGEIRVSSSVDSLTLPQAEFELRISNRTDNEISLGFPTAWKVIDGEYFYLQPTRPAHLFPHLGVRLGPNGTESFNLTVDNESETMEPYLPGAGPGKYLFSVTEGVYEPDEVIDEMKTTELRFVGDAPDHTPVSVEETSNEDGILRLRMQTNRGSEDDTGRVSISTGEDVRREAPNDTPELIREQVFQFAVVRNAVYYLGVQEETHEMIAEGSLVSQERRVLDEVRREDRYPYFSSNDDSLYFGYDGDIYRIELYSEVNATETTVSRGEVNVINEEFHVSSPHGQGSPDPISIVNDGDETVRCTVEVLEDGEPVYTLRIELGPYGTYTDGLRIAREGVYDVRVETEGGTVDGRWHVGDGYTGFVVEPDEPRVSQVKRRGTVEVRTPDTVPKGDPVPAEDISEYGAVYEAIEQHHGCETGDSDDGCETVRTVAGEDWVVATRASEEYTSEDGSGVYVEYRGNVYVFTVETEV